MKRLLILTGPQGSGNHVWSKIFALHPAVFGWRALLDEYWIGHDQEPFADCWRDPSKLADFDWAQRDYFVTSMSVPYMENGVPTIPDIAAFRQQARDLDVDVDLIVLGRDRNVLGMQETRLRGGLTYPEAAKLYETLLPNFFLSYELLQLYDRHYLKNISESLKFPIAWYYPTIDTILKEDANKKYFHDVEHHWVDDLARKTSSPWR